VKTTRLYKNKVQFYFYHNKTGLLSNKLSRSAQNELTEKLRNADITTVAYCGCFIPVAGGQPEGTLKERNLREH